jgi:hypothetical protein
MLQVSVAKEGVRSPKFRYPGESRNDELVQISLGAFGENDS